MGMGRVVGNDIAKSVFQVCVWIVDGSVAWNNKSLAPDCWILSDNSNPELLLQWRPAPLHSSVGEPYPPWAIASDSPHTTRESFCPQPEERGYDALAICETALRQGIYFVSVINGSDFPSRRHFERSGRLTSPT